MARRRVERESVPELLHHPVRCRVVGCVEVEDPAAVVVDDEEAVQDVHGGRWYREEVHAGNGVLVVAKEGHPPLEDIRVGVMLAETSHVAGHRGFGDRETKLF